MSAQVNHRPCPHCRGVGVSHTNLHMAHGGSHMAAHAITSKHGHPLALVAGLGIAAYQLARSTIYTCRDCGRRFVKLT